MDVKESLLEGLKPALTEQIKQEMAKGELQQPVDFEATMDRIWRALRMNVQTAGALMVFKIKRDDVSTIVKQVLMDLKIEVI